MLLTRRRTGADDLMTVHPGTSTGPSPSPAIAFSTTAFSATAFSTTAFSDG
ncbi:hypothetical protein [Streptomyces rimosus]|uniref:hypothetical protein n=1 Tax=Streptomyces rimosus TaxID=1927 RepID=UPI000A9BBAB2|nr:hypothetical protein [Streptomyces rimosus]